MKIAYLPPFDNVSLLRDIMSNVAEVVVQFRLPILNTILIRFRQDLVMAVEVIEEGVIVTRGGFDRGASICWCLWISHHWPVFQIACHLWWFYQKIE